jgi:hypothetical protein
LSESHIQTLRSKFTVPQLAGGNFPIYPGPDNGLPGWKRSADRWAKSVAILFFPWGLHCPTPPTTHDLVIERLWEYRDSEDEIERMYYEIIKDFASLLAEPKSARTAYAKFRGMCATVWDADNSRDKFRNDTSGMYETGQGIQETMNAFLDAAALSASDAEKKRLADLRIQETTDALGNAFARPITAARSSRAPIDTDSANLKNILDNISNGRLDEITEDACSSSLSSVNLFGDTKDTEETQEPIQLNAIQSLARDHILRSTQDPEKQLLLCIHGGV